MPTIVEPKWINAKKERTNFFFKELREYLEALEGASDTYDTFDEVGISVVQLVPDYVPPELQRIKNKKYYDAAAKLNRKGDEWDRLHPNDKCKRIQIK